jgi:hypothetical protein
MKDYVLILRNCATLVLQHLQVELYGFLDVVKRFIQGLSLRVAPWKRWHLDPVATLFSLVYNNGVLHMAPLKKLLKLFHGDIGFL